MSERTRSKPPIGAHTETLHRRRRRKSSRQRGMSKALHDVEGTEVPMFSRAGRGRKSSCSLGQSEVLVVSGHRKTSRLGAHRYVDLSRLAGIVDLAVGGRIPSSCKPPSRRIYICPRFTHSSEFERMFTHPSWWDLDVCRWIWFRRFEGVQKQGVFCKYSPRGC